MCLETAEKARLAGRFPVSCSMGLARSACLLLLVLAHPGRAGDDVPQLRFVESGGVLAIEAEHYSHQAASTYPEYKLPHSWAMRPDPGAGGGVCLEVTPDERGEDGLGPASPRDSSGAELRYPIRIASPGVYHVFVRGRCRGGESNGVHVGVNGRLAGRGPGASNISGFRPRETWCWEHRRKHGHEGTAILELEAGEHVLHVWSRDDGFQIDRLVLSLFPDFPDGPGPAESATVSASAAPTAPEQPPPLSP